jgi:enoyl-CoA hydratase/carnithine racemase
VAALNGVAFGGGCELAAACDLRVAHDAVKLGMPPARLGIIYAARGLARFSAIVGESRARRMFLWAHTVDAAIARDWGLVDELVSASDVRSRAIALASEAAALAPLAVQGMRRTFERLLAQRAALPPVIAQDLEARRLDAWRSTDAAEARLAFAEKRTPRFRGE